MTEHSEQTPEPADTAATTECCGGTACGADTTTPDTLTIEPTPKGFGSVQMSTPEDPAAGPRPGRHALVD